jgi:type I restriction enzyme S subunit
MSWKTVALGDICEFTRGLTYSKIDEVEFSNNAVLRATNIDLESNKLNLKEIRYINNSVKINEDKKVKLNDILICTASGSKSHLGKVALINEQLDMAFGGFMAVLRVKENIEAKFLFNYLTSDIFLNHISKLADGANINNLKFSQIQNLKINLPPLATQQKIVAKLDAIFAEIDKATAASEVNIKNVEALFQSYLRQVFEQDSEGWKKIYLKDIAEYFNGLTYSPKNVCENGTIVLRSSNIQKDKIDLDDIVRVDSAIKDKLYVKSGDILMCSRNGSQRLIGKTATINDLNERMTFGTFMMIIRSDNNFFLKWFFKSDLFKNQIISGENTMINQITRYMLDEIVLSLPDVSIQKLISNKISNLYINTQKLKLNYISKINEFSLIKQSILKQAFNGELVKAA